MAAARGRELVDLRADVRKRADVESATDRHPDADVTRYINQGGAEVWDLLIGARGPEFFRADPSATITTTANTTSYTLPTPFRSLINVWLTGIYGMPMVPFTSQEEPTLRLPVGIGGLPTHYQLRRHTDGTNILELLPIHQPGLVVQVDYVPAYVDMVADGDTFDGINGWEEYVVWFAALCIATKDDEEALAARCEKQMERLRTRIQALAPKRDMHRARRVKDVRGGRFPAWLGRRWG